MTIIFFTKVQLAEFKINAIIAETKKQNVEDLYVPGDACGRIIGKGGQSIREMCTISGRLCGVPLDLILHN